VEREVRGSFIGADVKQGGNEPWDNEKSKKLRNGGKNKRMHITD